jgi:hypothetical protein
MITPWFAFSFEHWQSLPSPVFTVWCQHKKKKRSEDQQGSCFNETNILEVPLSYYLISSVVFGGGTIE